MQLTRDMRRKRRSLRQRRRRSMLKGRRSMQKMVQGPPMPKQLIQKHTGMPTQWAT
jgi:hypothetical protein